MKPMYFKLIAENVTRQDKKLGIRKEMFEFAPYVLIKTEEEEVMATWVSEQQVKTDGQNISTELTDEYLGGLPDNCEQVSRKYYTERVTSS